MPKTAEENTKTKKKGKKIVTIIISVILAIAIVATAFIELTTLPKDVNDKNVIFVGGMVKDDNVDFQVESAKGLEKNPVVKIMQMVWRFCDGGDKKKHASQTPPDNITEIADIPYLDDDNHYHKLDVFYPDSVQPGDKLPVIIDVHGGGWMYADKDLNDYYCMALAQRGYVVFNISYRLVPDVTVNEQLQDVATALQWIKLNMADYPCDESHIMLTGDSAGGQMAVYSAVLLQSPELRETFGVVDADMDLTALLLTSPVSFMKTGGLFSIYTKLMWGSDYESKATYEYMDLNEIIDYAQLPPTFLVTSSGDSLAQEQTHMAYDLLSEKGVKCEILDVDKGEYNQNLPHVFSVLFPFDVGGSDTIDKASEFYQKAINGEL